MQPLRVIQVGMGNWGRDWARTILVPSPEIKCVGFVDPLPAMLLHVQQQNNVGADRCFSSLAAAFATVDTDAVLITASLPGHVSAALEALQAGKHVLLEKPFAPSVAEAAQVVAAADTANRILMISQNYRFYPAVRVVADLIRQQTLGLVSAVSVQFRKYANTAPVEGHGHYTIEQPLLLDMAIHHFDLMRYVLDQEPTTIACHAWNPPWSKFREPASASATIIFDRGAVVSYTGDWVSTAPQTTWSGAWQIECEAGVINWAARNDLNTAGDTVSVRPRGKRPQRLELPQIEHFDRAGTLHAFVQAVRTEQPPETSGRDNLMTLALTHAAIRAAQTHTVQSIQLP